MKNYAPVSVRERMYFVMASFISTRESIMLDEASAEGSRSEESASVKNSYLDDDEEESDEEENEESSERNSSDEEEDEDASDESYDSVASLNKKENSPPFKQAKFDKHDNKINSVYSSRMSMISSHDNVLRASAPMMNMNKNYIEIDNDYKKCQYLTKIFLQLPSCLYRLKLFNIEVDSKEVSRISNATQIGNHAEFLQEFSVLKQNYSLQTLDDLNQLVMFLENSFKDVQSIEGDESAFLEILLINNIVLFV